MNINSAFERGGEVIHWAREAAVEIISDAIAKGVDKSELMQVTRKIKEENQANFEAVNENLSGGFTVNVGRWAITAKAASPNGDHSNNGLVNGEAAAIPELTESQEG